MIQDLKIFLWGIKLGALINIYFLIQTILPPLAYADTLALIPARVLFTVSAFRCLFPVNYVSKAVLHNSPLSSIFWTRFFATFSEIAMIYLFSYLLRLFNIYQLFWVDIFSWFMVLQVVLSQCFVWGAILTDRLKLYFYEELGWWFIFAANTFASVYLYLAVHNFSGRELLIQLNVIFGIFYLPWQLFHLKSLQTIANHQEKEKSGTKTNWNIILKGFYQSIHVKNKSTQPRDWGGIIGITWMTSYWATLIPVWIYWIIIGI